MGSKVKAVVIEVDGRIRRTEIDTLESLQALVGGNIEGIKLSRRYKAFSYVNEDGIALGLPFNRVATAVCTIFGAGLGSGDFIKGPMVVVGDADKDGNDTDVPEELAKKLGV